MKSYARSVSTAVFALMFVFLAACQKTSNSSDPVAATPQSSYCPASGYYTNSSGQTTPCSAGQFYNPGGPTGSTNFTPPPNYPYQPSPTPSCNGYYAIYGVQYVPIYLSGQLVCANFDVLTSQLQQNVSYEQTPYAQFGASYYEQYPPYSEGGVGVGGGCGISIGVTYENFSGSVCF